MKKNKVKKKSKENELAIMLLMTCIALEENKYELSLSEEDEYTVEFSDPPTDIHGCISLEKDRKCSILMMDETTWVPSKASMKLFAEAYMKNDSDWRNHSEFNSELLMDGGLDHNTLLFYYDNIPIRKNATLDTFRSIILNASMNVLRFRKVLDQFNEADE